MCRFFCGPAAASSQPSTGALDEFEVGKMPANPCGGPTVPEDVEPRHPAKDSGGKTETGNFGYEPLSLSWSPRIYWPRPLTLTGNRW
jgi:hypothetical protein